MDENGLEVKMEQYTFDLQRILFGDLPLLFVLEIALRTTSMLIYALLLMRLMGKRSLGQLSLFEFVLIIALGSAVGDPMFYPNIPLLHGMVVITVVVLIERFLIWVTNRSSKIEAVLEGRPLCLIVDGRFHLDGLKRSSLSRNEIYMELRLGGVEQVGQVKHCYLEINGKMSIFMFESGAIRPGLSVLPDAESGDAEASEVATPVQKAGDYACLHCGEVVSLGVGQSLPDCPRCHHAKWAEADSTSVNAV
jgi:uncharacterized membrane protein YcaP (DUF421 family)